MTVNLHEIAEKLAKRPYTVIVFRDQTTDGDTVYLAQNPELDGCMAQGETIPEAQHNLDEFRIDYIEALLENEQDVPSPASMQTTTRTYPFLNIIERGTMEISSSFEDVLDEVIQPNSRELVYQASLKILG